ncbi:tRNA (N(6)-L-threonylcarbamoyladenosine(37)-C(2))-methylthiotransferase [Candidatus Woesearchaeota archaeon]|nr:tRNA (N(6)-L-threonylcarbamoyladenosine(37)-C(2))-methylthiotransferase [Candidatus Woesearchaeota archaeon]
MATIYLDNYGCTANYDNGAIIAGLLVESGHSIVNDVEESDVVVINSCAVKNVTVNKIFSQIEYIKDNYKDKKLVITGCMPVAEKDKLKNYMKEGIALVSTQNITEIPEAINKVLANEQVILTNKRKEIKLGLPKLNQDTKIASVQLAEGCRSFCSFCATKFAKGNLISYPKEKIIEEVKKYLKLGYKRINLTSTDNACYGFDLGYSIVDLLKEIDEIKGEFQVRVGMGNPEHVRKYVDELIEVYKSPKIMKFVHFPVQSGSNKILKEMKRNYKIEEFIEIVKKFRENIPGITISTDIIVGYPTETEEDFQQTIDLVKRLEFEVINISKFASRPRTLASKLKQLPTQIIKQRSVKMTKLYKEIRSELIESRIEDKKIKLVVIQ